MELVIGFSGWGPKDAMPRDEYIALRVHQPITADQRKTLADTKRDFFNLGIDIGDLSLPEFDELLFTVQFRVECDCETAKLVPHTRLRPLAEFKVAAAEKAAEIRERRR